MQKEFIETLRKDPYYFNADIEYAKGYRALVGVPGRVLQAKELSALSMYPIYAMNDIASEIFEEGIIQGLDVTEEIKLSLGSVLGMTFDSIPNISDIKVYEIEDDSETEIPLDLSELENENNEEIPIENPEEPEIIEDQDPELDRNYSVRFYDDTGEENWPQDII